MKHIITRTNKKVEITLLGIGEDGSRIVEQFGGYCAVEHECDPTRFSSLEALRATSIPDGITFEVHARPDTALDVDEVELCLDSAVNHILAEGEEEAER